MRILFRVEGDQGVGFGHLMRCLALADALRRLDVDVVFATNAAAGREVLERRGYPFLSARDDISSPEASDTREGMDTYCKRHPVQALIVDSYKVTRSLFAGYAKLFPLVGTIDDLQADIYPVSFLIHGSIGHSYKDYEDKPGCFRVLAGLEHCLLREEFEAGSSREIQEQVNNILVTTGSTDIDDMPVRIATGLADAFPEIRIQVVEGNLFSNKAGLRELAETRPNVTIHREVRSMRPLMEQADIAVSAGGITIYELMRCGAPIVGLVLAENQARIMEKLAADSYLVLARNCDAVISAVRKLSGDAAGRKELSHRGQTVMDGRGAHRTGAAIVELIHARIGKDGG